MNPRLHVPQTVMSRNLQHISLGFQLCHDEDLLIWTSCVLSAEFEAFTFSTALDTIDHLILLQRMENQISIKGSVLRWSKSRQPDRYNFSHVNDHDIITI